jgi:hypothetical protein
MKAVEFLVSRKQSSFWFPRSQIEPKLIIDWRDLKMQDPDLDDGDIMVLIMVRRRIS